MNDKFPRMSAQNFHMKYLSGPFEYNALKTWDYLCTLLDFADKTYPVVSVGCGNGYLESKLQQKYPNRLFYGVDPAPNSWNPVPGKIYENCLKPIAKNVENLMNMKEDKKNLLVTPGKNILLACWSNPDSANEGYVIGAIKRLTPDNFFVTYAPSGGCGSDAMVRLLDRDSSLKQRANSKVKKLLEISGIKYQLLFSYTQIIPTPQTYRNIRRCVGYCRVNEDCPSEKVILCEKEETERIGDVDCSIQ